jgi:sister-chromatid-cohesion protein PDS5
VAHARLLTRSIPQRMDQPGFRLAVAVCNGAADKLQRHVCQFFTDVIVEHAQAAEYDEVRAAHALVRRLHAACPALLHNVVPQLEEELRADDAQLRALAAQVLGEMLGDQGGRDLLRKYPATWDVWLGRRNDKDAAVRLTWVEATKGLIAGLPAVKEDLESAWMRG